MKRLKTRELVLEVRELLFVLDGDKRVGMFGEFFYFFFKGFCEETGEEIKRPSAGFAEHGGDEYRHI